MKKCPACHRVYDDAHDFCLEDGATLINSSETRRKSSLPLLLGGGFLTIAVLIGGIFFFSSRASSVKQSNEPAVLVAQTPIPTPFATTSQMPVAISPSPALTPVTTPAIETVITPNSNIEAETSISPLIAAPNDTPKPLPVIMKTEDHSVAFALHECRKSGTSITCLLSLTNKGKDRRFRFYGQDTKLFDELGNGYKGSEVQLANQTERAPEIDFISGVTAKAQITFENIESNAMKITLLDIHFRVGNDYSLSVKFRNVPLNVSK